MKVVKFRKGSGSLFYKLSNDAKKYFERPFSELACIPSLPPSKNMMRGINSKKKETLLKSLVISMPEEKRSFWKELAEADCKDLCQEL